MNTALVAIMAPWDLPYAAEWCVYHLNLGFDHIFIYCNQFGRDLPKLDSPRVHFIRADGDQMQVPSYNNFAMTAYKTFDWMMTLDIDEFLCLGPYANVKEMLAKFNDREALSLRWLLFGNSDLHWDKKTYSVLDRFTHSDDQLNIHVKTAVNLALLHKNDKLDISKPLYINPHCTRVTQSTADGLYFKGPWDQRSIALSEWMHPWIGHMFCKTLDEWKIRHSHGKADTDPRSPYYIRSENEFYEHNKNNVENLALLNAWIAMGGKK